MAANPYELTTREFLSILFKDWRKLAVIFIVLTLLVFGLSYLLTPYYQATARLLVKTGQEFQIHSNPANPVAAAPSTTKQEVVNSEIQILTSRDLIEAVINKIGIDRLYPGTDGWLSSEKSAMDAAVRKFYQGFSATPVAVSDVIQVSYSNPNHDVAVQALNELVNLYLKKHAQMFSDPRYKFLQGQTQQYQDQLAAVTRKIADLRNSKSLFDIDAQRAKLLDDRASINSVLQQLHSQSVDAHRRIDFLQGRLKQTPALVTAGASQADVVEQAKARLLDLQVKAEQLRQRYVGDVKPLQDTQAQIASLGKFIASPAAMNRKQWSQRNPAYDDMEVALNRALADAAPLDQQIALRTRQEQAIDQRLRDLENGATALDQAQREHRTLEELVHSYQTQYEQARMNENLSRSDIISVSVLQKPAAPLRPAGPHHLPFLLAGIVIGLIGAAGLLIYLLVFRETLITVESVERIIGVPVLASVPNSRMPGNDNRDAA